MAGLSDPTKSGRPVTGVRDGGGSGGGERHGAVGVEHSRLMISNLCDVSIITLVLILGE